MSDWQFSNSMFHCIGEIKKRINQIERLTNKLNSFEEFNDITRLEVYEIIIKQYVHIANFSMIGNNKAKESKY